MVNVCCQCLNNVGTQSITTCDLCKSSLHLSCLKLTADQALLFGTSRPPNIKLFCNRCNATINLINGVKEELQTQISLLKAHFDLKIKQVVETVNAGSASNEKREDILYESVERTTRSKNIILRNVPEMQILLT